MRVPDPKANTTTEAYLAYKAGYLEESELKPVLYEPYLHFDAWLAYWAGLTNEYPIDKNGDPEMLTDEEALVAYLSGVTDTYPEEIKDPYDARITGYLKYLVSARWGRPEYPVNNEEFYLSTMKPPVVPSGDTPSSDIEMDDTAEAPFIDLKMYGDTYQQTYDGSNLFNFRDTSDVGTVTTVSEDGFIMQSKDNSSGTGSVFDNYFTHNLALNTSTTYTIVIEVQAVSGSGMLVPVGNHSTAQSTTQLEYSFSDLHAGDIIVGQFNTKSSFSGDNGLRGYTRYGAGESGSITYRISVLADTSVTPETFVYQPYTGGIPAPNPEYPQPVNVVTGRQMVKVEGPNLFYGTNASSGGIVSSWSGSKVTLEGVTTSSYSNITGIDPVATLFPAGEYTFSTDTISNDYTKVIRIRENGSNHDYTIPKGGSSVTFTANESFNIRVCFISSLTTGIGLSDTFGLQLQQGSVATKYCPYEGSSYEINLGKNLFNTKKYSGNITITGLNSFEANRDTSRTANMFFSPRLPAGTYTLSYDISKNSINTYGISCSVYVVNGSSTSSLVLVPQIDGHIEFTFTSPTEVDRLYFYINQNAPSGSTASVSNIQVEVGASATPYAPYFEPIELCKIGDYQDYIYRDGDGDWHLHKETGKIVFNGSESWLRNDTNEVFTLADAASYSPDGTAPYSNYFKGQADVSSYARIENNSICFLMSSSSNRTVVKYSSETSANGFKAWLSTHNTIVYYPLATTADTQITNSELISQLDALMEGGSYEGKTYIKVTATDPNLPGLLYVEAGKYD